MDPFEAYDKLLQAGPATAELASRRAEVFSQFREANGFDPESHAIANVFFDSDARERAVILNLDEEPPFVPEAFSARPTLEVPPELDSLSLMRSARSEGWEHPNLAAFESAALAAGRA